MSGTKLLAAAGATALWLVFGVFLFGIGTVASSLGLAVSGPILNLVSLLEAWLLVGVILGAADILILWDMLSGW
jgi:energy-converting hydrogenase Eha subunit E